MSYTKQKIYKTKLKLTISSKKDRILTISERNIFYALIYINNLNAIPAYADINNEYWYASVLRWARATFQIC